MRRNAVLFVAVSLLSGFGGSAMALVAGIWIFDLTGSPSLAALAGHLCVRPTLAGPWLGGLVDRLPRRPVVVAANLALAAALPTLLAVHGPGQVWLLYLVSTVYGIGLRPDRRRRDRPAARRALPRRTRRRQRLALQRPGGRQAGGPAGRRRPVRLAGRTVWSRCSPPPAGPGRRPLRRAAPDRYAVACRAAPDRYAAPAAPRPRSVRAGLAVLFGSPAMRLPVCLAAVAIGMSGFATAAGYAVVTELLGLPVTFLGVLVSAQGAGSVAGGLVVGRLIARYGPTAVAVAGTAAVRPELPGPLPALVAGGGGRVGRGRRRAAVGPRRGRHRRADPQSRRVARPGRRDRQHGHVRADRGGDPARFGRRAAGRTATAPPRRRRLPRGRGAGLAHRAAGGEHRCGR